MTRPSLLLLHGWGFDSSLWDSVCAELPEFTAIKWNRGYFGSPANMTPSTRIVAVGHSLGAMLLARDLPMEVPLVAINGFDRFAGEGAVPSRIVKRMRQRFMEDPEMVLNNFRARCGAPPAPDTLDVAALGADLSLLASYEGRRDGRDILVLHGGDDPILSERLREEVFAGAPRETQEGAGHLLPITHASWTAARIRAFLCA